MIRDVLKFDSHEGTAQPFTSQSLTYNNLEKEAFLRKGENAGNLHFVLIPQCFLLFSKQTKILQSYFLLMYANAFTLEQSKLLFGK